MKACGMVLASFVIAACSANEPKGGTTISDSGVDAGPSVTVLAGPSELHGANGLRFDAEGRLYVGSVSDGKLYRLDPDTGETLQTLGAESGVESPDDLTIGPDGTLYVANILQGTIVAIAPDGSHRVVTTLPGGVDGIALSPAGKLIIGMDFFADGLYEVDPTGTTAPRTVNATPGWINAMAFAPDGTLYAPVWKNRYVAKVDLVTGTVTQHSREFAGTPGAVKFDSAGRLFAVDGAVGDLQRIDLATGDLTPVLRYGKQLDNLAFDASDRLFISSYGDGSVHEVLASGSLRVVKAGGLISPVALAVSSDASETVYVAEPLSVHAFDGVGGALRESFCKALGLPGRVTPVALRVTGDMILALGASSLEVWDRVALAVQSSAPVEGGADVIEFQGSRLVSQPLAGNIVVVADEAGADGGALPFASGLGDPAGLAATNTDLFVSIYGAGEIRQVVEGGVRLDPPRVVASGLAAPEGLAVLPSGDLAVVETGTGDVVRVNRTTGEKAVLAAGLSPSVSEGTAPALGGLNALGLGPSGHLYVLSPVDRKVHKVRF